MVSNIFLLALMYSVKKADMIPLKDREQTTMFGCTDLLAEPGILRTRAGVRRQRASHASSPTRRLKDYDYAVDADCHLRHRAPAALAVGPVQPGPHPCGRPALDGPGRCAPAHARERTHSPVAVLSRTRRHSAGRDPRASHRAGARCALTAGAPYLPPADLWGARLLASGTGALCSPIAGAVAPLHYGQGAVAVTRAGSRDS